MCSMIFCTTTARLWTFNLCSLCWFPCCLWFTQPIFALVTVNQACDPRQDSQFDQGSIQQLCQLCPCIAIWEFLVHDRNWSSPRMCIGTWLFCHWCGLVAGKNCWHQLDRSVFWTTLFFRSGLRWWCGSSCRVTWTPCACTWDDGNRSRISWARAELTEDKSPSFGQQGGRTIINHCSGSGGCNGRRVCLPWLPGPLINSKLTWCLMSQCHQPCGCAESRQTDLKVKNHHYNHAKVV